MPRHRADRLPATREDHRGSETSAAPDRGGDTTQRRRRVPGRPGPTAVGAALLVATAAAAVVLLPRAPEAVRLSASAATPSARPQARIAAVTEAGSLRAVRATLAGRREQAAVSRDLSRVGHVDVAKQVRTEATAVRERKARERAARLAAARAEAARRARQWQLPVTPGAYHLTARFGSCSGLWSHCHTGLDFAAPTGTPIHAVATGSITGTGWDGSYGNKTVETLPDGTELWYAHQTAYTVHVGERVTAGEVIGSVGSTGNTTGPHVHLEVRPSPDHPIDPFAALVSHGLHP